MVLHHQFRPEQEQPSAGHGVPGVDGEVEHHLLDLPGVGENGRQVASELRPQLDVLTDGAAEHLLHGLDDLVEIEGLGVDNLPPPEDQQLAGEGGRPFGRNQDLVDVLRQGGVVGHLLRHEPPVAQDEGQDVVEVVGDPTGELTEDLEPLRLAGLEHLPLRLHPFAVRHVADGGGNDDPVLRLEGRQRDLRRKLAPVPTAAGQVQPGSHRARGRVGEVPAPVAGVKILDRVGNEDLDALAEKVRPLISEEPLGLAVDEDDPAVGVDTDHSIGRRLQEAAELGLGPAAVAAVAYGGGHEPPFLRLQGTQADFRRKLSSVSPRRGELPAGAHRPEDRLVEISIVEHGVPDPGRGRNEDFYRPSDDCRPPVAEQRLGLQVEKPDLAGGVDHDHRVGHRVQDRGDVGQTHPNLPPHRT